MKVLIVGNKSIVGQRLCRDLSKEHIVKTTGRTGNPDIYLHLDLPNYREEVGRINEEFDVVIHCAASFRGNDIEDSIDNEMVNSVGALIVGFLAEKVKCKHLIYISTIFTYDVPENGYFGSYGLSKRHGQENLEFMCKRSGIGFTALMPSQIYDEHGLSRKHQPLFYHIIDCALDGRDISFFGSINPVRNFLFVGDLSNIIAKLVNKPIPGTFPCVFPVSYTVSEMAQTAYSVFGTEGQVFFRHEMKDLPTTYIPDDTRLYQLIGYTPHTDLKSGMLKIRNNMINALGDNNV